jgi:hypothetical protein
MHPPSMSGSSAGLRLTGLPTIMLCTKFQAGYKVTPLSRLGQAAEPVVGAVDSDVDMKTPPKTQVDTMPPDKFFAYAAEILELHPPHVTDQPILAHAADRHRERQDLRLGEGRSGHRGWADVHA